MCTMIVTIRTVLWYVMSLAGTLLILVAMFTNKWLEGHFQANILKGDSLESVGNSLVNLGTQFASNVNSAVSDSSKIDGLMDNHIGLFTQCTDPVAIGEKKFFEGECIPDLKEIKRMFDPDRIDNDDYPHAWRGAVVCFTLGLGIMVITDLFALLTICCRRCICCSVFTVCGSFQSVATIAFTLGLVAYPAGWGTKLVQNNYCGLEAGIFQLGDCKIGFAFWLAVAGTVCTMLASSLAIWAYQSTKSERADERISQGEKYICLP